MKRPYITIIAVTSPGRTAYVAKRNGCQYLTDDGIWVESIDHPDVRRFPSYETAEEAAHHHRFDKIETPVG